MENNELKKHLFVLILCGGGGKRLWPKSRIKTPKQFIKIFGEETIFQKTVARAAKLVPFKQIYVVTNFDYLDEVRSQAPQIPKENILAEPQAKNTALAVGYGAVYIKNYDPEAVIINLPSDHFIKDVEKLNSALLAAAEAAVSGNYLVILGIKPQSPETGFGYIHAGDSWETFPDRKIFKVKEFTEKPDLVKAQSFLSSGDYFWNAGIYVFRISNFLSGLKEHAPKTYQSLLRLEKAIEQDDKAKIKEIYFQSDDLSLDYALAEKANNLLVVVGDFDWNDIGDWNRFWEIAEKDESGNVIIKEKSNGDFVGLEVKNSLIYASNRLIAVIGAENLIIIDTAEALLVCPKNKAEEVKKLVNGLKEQGKLKYL